MILQNYQDAYSSDSNVGGNEPQSFAWYLQKEKNNSSLLGDLNNRASAMITDTENYVQQSKLYTDFYEVDYTTNFRSNTRIHNFRRSWNLIRTAVDGHYNRVAKITPKVSLLAKGDTQDINQLATKVDDYLLRLFNQEKIHEASRESYKDGLITNLGWYKIIPNLKKKTFNFTRVLPYTIAVERPYIGNNYRTELVEFGVYKICDVYQMLMMNNMKERAEMFKKHYNHRSTDEIKVFEMYKAGYKKTIFTKHLILDFSDWKFNWIPYEKMLWDNKLNGIIGTGMSELLCPTQNRINALLYRIDRNTEFFSNQYVILPQNSNFKQMNNGFGNFYEARMPAQQKPIHITPPILHEQVFQHLERNWEMGLKIARLSELQVEGRMPKGLSQPSGVALDYYNDIENSRFFVNIKNYEQSFIRTAKKVLEWGCDIYPNEEPFTLLKNKKEQFFNRVNTFTSNLLPETPAGRARVLSQLVSLQIIKPEKFMELLDAPDVTGFLRSETARISAIEKYLQEQFFNGEPAEVDPVLGYEEQREIALKIYSQIVKESEDSINDTRLENIRDFMKDLKERIDEIKKTQLQSLMKGNDFGGQTPAPAPPMPDPNTKPKTMFK